MTYDEACEWIALNKPLNWQSSAEELERDMEEARRMSSPDTWPQSAEREEFLSWQKSKSLYHD